jgi:hypothetical protein
MSKKFVNFDDLLREFASEVDSSGIFTVNEVFGLEKFIKTNKERMSSAVEMFKSLEAAKRQGHYDHGKTPLALAADLSGVSAKALALELERLKVTNESVLIEYLKESD